MIEPTPVLLEIRIERLRKAPSQAHRHAGPDVFRFEPLDIALAGDELLEILAPTFEPARLVARNRDGKFLAPDSVEQSEDQIIERLPLDPIVPPVAFGDDLATGRWQSGHRVRQELCEILRGQSLSGHGADVIAAGSIIGAPTIPVHSSNR